MRRVISGAISLLIVTVIFLRIDRADLVQRFHNLDGLFFSLSMALFIPQILVAAKRWQALLCGYCDVSLWSSTRVILASNTLNVILPSKLGDLAKAYFLGRRGELDTGVGVVLVVIEKLLDIGALCTILLLGVVSLQEREWKVLACGIAAFSVVILTGLLFLGERRRSGISRLLISVAPLTLASRIERFSADWARVLSELKRVRRLFISLLGLSLLLWLLHLTQIYLFFLALNYPVPILLVYALVPIAIFIGLVPISFAGIGTRDSALIYLFSPYATPSVMAGVGILCSVRYFVPALFGLPFFHEYMIRSKRQAG